MKAIEAVKFIKDNKKYFPSDKTDYLITKLTECDRLDLDILDSIKFTLPIRVLILSIIFGIFGADRFFIGDYKTGFIKLFTLGGLGLLMIFDWFYILKRIKYVNYVNLLGLCYYHTHNF